MSGQRSTFQGGISSPDGAPTALHHQTSSRPVNTDAHMSNLLLLKAQRMDRFGDRSTLIAR
jgi:hypothetical protein